MAKLAKSYSDQGPVENQVYSLVTPELDEAEWGEIGTYLFTLLVNAVAERSTLNELLLVYNQLYEGLVPEGKQFPWPDSANLNVPVVQTMMDGLNSRIAKVALGVSPLVLVKGDDQEGVDVQYKAERYFDAVARKIEAAVAINTGIHLGLRDGASLLKVVWDYRTRKIRARKLVPLTDENDQPIIDPDSVTTGKPKPLRREATEIDDIVEWDDVRVLPVELKDFYLLPSHAYSLDRYHAKGVAERVWMRWDELYARGKSGMYDPAQVEKLREMTAASRLYTLGVNFLEQDTILGKVNISYTPGLQEYEVFEIIMWYDLDKDGYEELCLFTFVPRFAVMLRAEVFPYWHQLPPYVPIILWPRPNRFYGFSVPERLESIQREVNAIHNQRLDMVSLNISPPLKIKKSAILLGAGQQPWGPGARLEVNDPTEIEVMQMPQIHPEAFTEENILFQYAERVVGMYDVNTPRGTGSRRTRSEIGAIQEESMVRFDYMVKHAQRSVVNVFEMIKQLKIQYMPDVEHFEAVGPSGGVEKFEITRAELLGHFHFVANGDLPVADKERFRQESYFLYGALMQNPLVIQKPTRIYAVTEQLLQAWESKAAEKMIGTIEDAEQEEQAAQQAQAMMGAPPGAGGGGTAAIAQQMMQRGGRGGGGGGRGPQGQQVRPRPLGGGTGLAGPQG